jgi:hypothetical protein
MTTAETDNHDLDGALNQFDHRGPICMDEDPRPFLRSLREKCPVGHTDAYGGSYFLTTYRDVFEASRNPGIYSSAQGVSVPPHGMAYMPPIEYDPPMQAAFRSPLISHFSPAAIAQYEPKVRQTVDELIDRFIERGEADLATELSMPLPAIVTTPVLGIPDEDRDKVRGWAERIVSGGEGFDLEAGMAAINYFAELYERRKVEPADDLTTLVMSLDILGRPITKDEFLPMMVLLMTGGLDTTTSAASHIMIYLAENPDQRAVLQRRPELIPGAVEELLRMVTPIPVQARTMKCPVSLHGVDVPEGERIQLVFMSANHDPDEFPEPDRIDFERKPNRHFSFGIGVHRCLGAHLARLELKVLLEVLLSRVPNYRIAEPGVVRHSGVTRGVSHLPVRFTPGKRVTSP